MAAAATRATIRRQPVRNEWARAMAREISEAVDAMVAVECEIGERSDWSDPRIAAIERDIAAARAARARLLEWRYAW